MKISPNFQDSNRIKEMYAAGQSVDDISRRVGVEAGAVQRHIDTCGAFVKKEPEMSPQMRGSITRKAREAARAAKEQSDGDQEDEHQEELQREGTTGSY